ncbi:hypothetical protein NP493_3946g00002 [Ridgeia piscesae]|uniref:TFIIS-type domain-containing protein n=1 Tax=Ridgeia piscesae TaxID=27915 RepID=A0AAD9J3J4_RIDPI|nr:hypothetical protein NP493_3946g00002 [Ridgeia piscesae]
MVEMMPQQSLMTWEQPSDLTTVTTTVITTPTMLTHTQDKMIIGDVIADPSLPRTEDHPCPKCGHREAVFFQSQSRRQEEGMQLYYVCTQPSCTHRWTE